MALTLEMVFSPTPPPHPPDVKIYICIYIVRLFVCLFVVLGEKKNSEWIFFPIAYDFKKNLKH